jgi:cyanophycinase-like exopeptidase
MRKFLLCAFLLPFVAKAQTYTSYFTGNTNDTIASPQGGICLMGGATENDEAMKWFLQKANGGDILVLRASGSDGYNAYLYSQLGVPVNSVETIVCNSAAASTETYLQDKIAKAEGIWFAGGDQWNYISYWRNTKIDSLINVAILSRNIVIGGTSAGMAIMGKYYFSAQNGSVTSATAMMNPYDNLVQVSNQTFLKNNILNNTITDTHFDNPDRKGRIMTFIARALKDNNVPLKGIACDEYTSVCIEPNGIAKVYGDFPTEDDNAYFIQPNCELANFVPETCIANSSLTFNYNGKAVKVYKVKGTSTGANTFNLQDWKTGSGGAWETWSVNSGVFAEASSVVINCSPASLANHSIENSIQVYPNPSSTVINIETDQLIESVSILNSIGQIVLRRKPSDFKTKLDIRNLQRGIYQVKIVTNAGSMQQAITVN